MHYTRPLFRNPDGPQTLIECTHGCTHNKCAFCTMYKGITFGVTPLDVWEEDLKELAARNPHITSMQWVGGNPFALPYHHLKERAELVHTYLPDVEFINMQSRVTDLRNKTVEQLRELRKLGIAYINVGHESGDDWALAFVNKGYTSADILEQMPKLDEAGITYSCTFLNGLVDREHSEAHAINSARVFNQLHPEMVGSGSVALFGSSKLQEMAEAGAWTPLTEKERMEELRLFLSELSIPCRIITHHSSALQVMGRLPKDKERMIGQLTNAIDNYEQFEERMNRHRASITQL